MAEHVRAVLAGDQVLVICLCMRMNHIIVSGSHEAVADLQLLWFIKAGTMQVVPKGQRSVSSQRNKLHQP